MDYLQTLEDRAVFILREAYNQFKSLAMLWSIGKDSTVLLHLTRKAFFGHIPYPLVHIDTGHKIPEMIEYRDKVALELGINMVYGQNEIALKNRESFPDGNLSRVECCKKLKTEALRKTLDGTGLRYKLNHEEKKYLPDSDNEPYTAIILGIRSDEEGSRSKERYFSPRDSENEWLIDKQPPEFWNQYNTDFKPGTHLRIHPLLDWTEVDIWRYIKRENIDVVSLYLNNGRGKRYRSLGCAPCTKPVESKANSIDEIIEELESGKFSKVAERSGRDQDKEDGGGLETLRRSGYM